MANLKSAQKKVRKDIKRSMSNATYFSKIDQILRSVRTAKKAGGKSVSIDLASSYSAIDKAAKRKIISKQRATRLKSKISAIK